MQEHEVTVGQTTYPLPDPFFVIATQNPIEQEGTYPLPEAQLDRFLMQIDVDYPDAEAERRMLIETTGPHEGKAKPVLTALDVKAATNLVRRMPIGDQVVDGILELVRSARPDEAASETIRETIAWGPAVAAPPAGPYPPTGPPPAVPPPTATKPGPPAATLTLTVPKVASWGTRDQVIPSGEVHTAASLVMAESREATFESEISPVETWPSRPTATKPGPPTVTLLID